MKKNEKAITLIALIITIILLLILASVVLNLAIGENGIFKLAGNASKNYMNAQEKEKSEIAKVEEYIQNGRETVTIDKEEYEALIPSSVGDESLLMSSNNYSLEIGNFNLTSFTNNFSESYEKYFSYDSNTGELTCKKAGWYLARIEIYTNTNTSSSIWSYVSLFINNVHIGRVKAIANTNSKIDCDSETITFYLRTGEKLKFSKDTAGTPATWACDADILLYKI